ncbi:unnamed protein product, partial [Effrenium voratum]
MASAPAQVYGQPHSAPAAELQRQMASAATETGVREVGARAKHGFFEVKAYIQENPSSIKIMSFVVGLVLIAFSILGCINPFQVAFQPKEYLCNVYNVLFGVVICICDGKESWMRSCGDIQAKLFQKAFFLATQTGRALLSGASLG